MVIFVQTARKRTHVRQHFWSSVSHGTLIIFPPPKLDIRVLLLFFFCRRALASAHHFSINLPFRARVFPKTRTWRVKKSPSAWVTRLLCAAIESYSSRRTCVCCFVCVAYTHWLLFNWQSALFLRQASRGWMSTPIENSRASYLCIDVDTPNNCF